MVTVFEIGLAAGVAAVVASAVAVIWRRVGERPIVVATMVLAALAAAGGVAALTALGVNRDDARPLAVACAGLALAAGAEAGLIWLGRWLRGVDAIDEALGNAIGEIDAQLDAHRRARASELERTLAQERAESSHLLTEQERELAAARREAVEGQARVAAEELTLRAADEQARHAERLSEWSADLDRSQRELKDRLDLLVRDQASALDAHHARIERTAAELRDLSHDQQEALERLRADFAHLVAEAFDGGRADLEVHDEQMRRDVSAVNERLRELTRSLREEADREEADARVRIGQDVAEIERRVLERFGLSLDRAADRLTEDAERRFDAQIRASREETAQRLSRELERTMEHFTREMEREVEERMSEVAHLTAARLQRQLDDVVRQSEAQAAIAEERITFITGRLDQVLAAAAGRLAVFETDLELELTSRVAEFERAVRQAAHTVDHEAT